MILAWALTLVTACTNSSSSVKLADNPAQVNGHAKETPNLFDGQTAFSLLKQQVDMGPRKPNSEAHAKCLAWMVEKAKRYTDKVYTQEFSHRWSKTGEDVKMANVIAEMNVSGAFKTALVLAHWDTRPTADQEDDPARRKQPIPGANDGASGVAVLLELMRVFKQSPPSVNVIFLFVDGEDLGPGLDEMFLGATYYSKNLPAKRPDYGILLDMIGDKDLVIAKEQNSAAYARDLQDRFYRNAQVHGRGKAFPNTYQGAIYDDHLPLNQAGIPTIDLIDFEYPDWHKLSDTADKCSPGSLATVGRAVETFLREESAK